MLGLNVTISKVFLSIRVRSQKQSHLGVLQNQGLIIEIRAFLIVGVKTLKVVLME